MQEALIIIDAQRGFMPAEEGERLEIAGFGELPIRDGEQIVRPINQLIEAFAGKQALVITTQDWHPAQTAHFAEKPNFTTTWPTHCVADTLGASLHPQVTLPAAIKQYIKGTEALIDGADDTSYSAYYATNQEKTTTLPELLQKYDIHKITLAGLALDYCVDKTAQDLRIKLGLDVSVAIDATRGISEATSQAAKDTWHSLGIHIVNTQDIIARIKG